MKKKSVFLSTIITISIIASLVITGGNYYALNPQEELQVTSIKFGYKYGGAALAYETIVAYKDQGAGGVSSAVIQECVNAGVLAGYEEQLKALGYTDVDYSAAGGGNTASSGNTDAGADTSSNNTSDETTSAEDNTSSGPTPFTVEDMDETPMWAVDTVNYRDGASTEYNRLGSLDKHQQVTVNGVASTGWYRFLLEDGSEAYVSNNYLTTEDPSSRELNIYNEDTGQVDTYTFEGQDPDGIDQAIEDIKDSYAQDTDAAAVTDDAAAIDETVDVVAVEEPAAEDDLEEADAEQIAGLSPAQYALIAGAIICAVILIICIVQFVRARKGKTKE